MNNNVTNQETYTVKEHTLLEVRHENGMTANYELDKENSCLELKTVYAKDEKLIELELPAFIIFEDVNLPVTSIAACILKDMEEYGKIKKVIIPPTVTHISEYAFIRYPNSLSQIEVSNHEVLENVYIPKGIDVLTDTFETVDLRPKHHFRITDPKNGYSLLFQMNDNGNKLTLSGHENIAKGTCVVIPREVNGYPVTKIGNDAFSWCSGLTGIVIPNSVREIGKDAFFHCENLTNVVIPDSVVKIKFCAFANCSHLSGIIIPESVMDIEENVFGGCHNLSTIVVAENNKFYDSREDCNAIIETATNTLVQGCNTTVIPDTVTKIESCAFIGCEEMEDMVIPKTVTQIGHKAFGYCQSMTDIVIPESVKKIGNDVFKECNSLKSIVISDASLLQCAGVPVGAKVTEKKSLLGNIVQALLEHENQQ